MTNVVAVMVRDKYATTTCTCATTTATRPAAAKETAYVTFA
jgi:hypothetical protein